MATRLAIAALVCCIAAVLVYVGLRGIYGPRPAYVYVRWSPNVTESQRRSLEHEHTLTHGEYRDGTTWRYLMTDVSPENIGTLVQDPAAEDTHHIDRTAFRPAQTAPRDRYFRRGAIPGALEAIAVILIGVGVLALMLAGVKAAGPPLWRGVRPIAHAAARVAADPAPVAVTARRHQHAAIVLAALCIAAAFVPARNAVRGVTLPHDIDEFRDIAAAQAIADGKGLQDPFYRGETIWYNPLLAGVVAALSRVSATAVPETYVQAGPYLNLLAPVMLFVLGAILFDAWAALLALAFFLYSPAYVGAATPSYSPWLYPVTFTSAVFYLGVLACWAASSGRLPWAWVTTGVMLGVTFLGHTAPAMILGVCVLSAAYMSGGTRLARARRALAALAIAAVVSVPLLASIVGHYRLQILNPAPASFVLGFTHIENAWNLLASAVTLANLLALIGLVAVLRDRERPDARVLLLAWGFTACGLFLYGWLFPLMPDRVPPVVPQFHFYFYIRALGYLLTGVGIWTVIRLVVSRLAKPQWRAVPSSLAAAAVAAIVCVAWYDGFHHRRNFGGDRSEALGWTDDLGRSRLLTRLRQQTPHDAVVLANINNSIYRVAPAGRAVVAVRKEFSNPYVHHERRRQDQQAMLLALLSGDITTFRGLAERYGVTHVLLGPDEADRLDRVALSSDLRELSREGGYSLLSVSSNGLRAAPLSSR